MAAFFWNQAAEYTFLHGLRLINPPQSGYIQRYMPHLYGWSHFTMKRQLITISFLSAFALNAGAGEDFYKWVDDKGVTHYSQSPPETTGKSAIQTINVRTRIPHDSAQAIADLEKKRAALLKSKEDGEKKKGDDKTAATEKSLNKEKCPQWKQDVEVLQKANVSENDGKGNVKVMSEEDKKKRLEQTLKYIKDNCS